MGRFFVSYRRLDIGYAGWINEILTFELGAERMFFDVEALRAGDDFDRQLDEELADCDAMLVVIGPAWREQGERSGVRRLHEPRDYVRREVERALEREIPVIPVLVGDTPLPAAADLPDHLRPLLRRQAVELSDESFRHEARRLLVSRLKEIPSRKAGLRTDSPTCVLSPVHVDARSLSPETAGAFAFLWLAETFSSGSKRGLRLGVGHRSKRWIGLYDVPVGERFGLEDDGFHPLPIEVVRPNVGSARALQIFLHPISLVERRKIRPDSMDVIFLPQRVQDALLGTA